MSSNNPFILKLSYLSDDVLCHACPRQEGYDIAALFIVHKRRGIRDRGDDQRNKQQHIAAHCLQEQRFVIAKGTVGVFGEENVIQIGKGRKAKPEHHAAEPN